MWSGRSLRTKAQVARISDRGHPFNPFNPLTRKTFFTTSSEIRASPSAGATLRMSHSRGGGGCVCRVSRVMGYSLVGLSLVQWNPGTTYFCHFDLLIFGRDQEKKFEYNIHT